MSEFTQPFPNWAGWSATGVAVTIILAVAGIRTGVLPAPASAPELRAEHHVSLVTGRSLSFADRADGALVVTNAATGKVVHVIQPGEPSGFIRGVLRGLMRERRMNGDSPASPFKLEQWADGALTLTDTVTGRVIELGSFGPDNRAAFARLLAATA
jgi:putative photosynthetic complex assembly protein